jgi:signal peptidase II
VGGGIGNLIDRALHQGAVVDFMNVGLGNLRTGIFNVADVALTGGAIALALWGLADYARTKRAGAHGQP